MLIGFDFLRRIYQIDMGKEHLIAEWIHTLCRAKQMPTRNCMDVKKVLKLIFRMNINVMK